MKKRTIVASALSASALTAGYALIDQFTKRALYRESLDKENRIDWYSDLGGVKVKIKNHKNLFLQAYLFEEEGATKTIIGLHSLKKSAIALKETIRTLKALYPNSNVLLYDANAHGLSDGYIRGLGYKDIPDLMYFNTYILQKYGEEHRVVMYGKGTGANTVLNAASLGKLKNVDMIISEGAYDQAIHYLAHLCYATTNVTRFVCEPIIRMIVKNEVGVDLKKLNTAALVKHNTIPTIFVHSKNDKEMPFDMVLKLYNNNKSEKCLFPLKEECLSDLTDFSDNYSSSLVEFLNDHK